MPGFNKFVRFRRFEKRVRRSLSKQTHSWENHKLESSVNVNFEVYPLALITENILSHVRFI